MVLNGGMMTSNTPEWATPREFFEYLDGRFGPFTLDVAANPLNAQVRTHFFTREDDGLKQTWDGVVWCNPPYGRGIGAWVKKAHDAVTHGSAQRVVVLVPARTDTKWWHDYAMKADLVLLVKGRLKFNDGANSAPFPSAVLVFDDPLWTTGGWPTFEAVLAQRRTADDERGPA